MPMTMPWPTNLFETMVWTNSAKSVKAKHLRESDEVQLLQILEELVVVIARDGLHDDADQHGDGQQDDFHQRDGGEFGKPVRASLIGSAS